MGILEELDKKSGIFGEGSSIFAGDTTMTDDQRIAELEKLERGVVEETQEEQPVVETKTQVEEEAPVVTPKPKAVERLANPSVDIDGALRVLTEQVGEEAAKKFIDSVVRPLAAQVEGAVTKTQQVNVERLVQKFGTLYPELKRKASVDAVIALGGGAGEAEFRAVLNQMYGDRKGEMRTQVEGQMSPPVRKIDQVKPRTVEEIEYAAFVELNRTGDIKQALALKEKLMAQR